MMRKRTTLTVGALLGSVIVPVAVGTAESSFAADTTATAVTDVELRWGLDNESNNAGYAPGTYNFFSAGKIENPGKGGLKITDRGRTWSNGKPARWSPSTGNVSIVKNMSVGPRTATWGGLTTDAKGRPIQSPTDSRFSAHEVVLANGEGWIDNDDGRAKVRWDGDFTVIYYSGMSFFYVSDPEINVGADGSGRLTATLGGYASSQYDQSIWRPVADRRVVIAELDAVDLSSGTARVQPAYKGVRVAVGKNGVQQVRTGRNWGAWPQSFVSYQQHTGQGSYWYSSGGQTDAHKVPLPIDVTGTSFGVDVTVPAGDPRDTSLPKESDTGPNEGGQDNNDGDQDGGDDNEGDDGGDEDDGPNNNGNDSGDGEPLTVDNAEFRWGINNESNNAGYAPGTHNFFSAGKIDDPGKGGQTLARSDWDPTAGNVTIEKRQSDGSYDTATWRGLSTTPSGDEIDSPTAGHFSDHQVVIDGGHGTVDPRRRTARITWDGDFTVLYYSGMTFFYVSDPTLVVRNGRGTVTATLGGFGSDRNDMTTWEKLPEKRVTVADLDDVSLGKGGFAAKPTYLGVRYRAPKSVTAQQHGQAFGSFPTSFVDYQVRTGQASYWYSSGGQTDRFKVALPMTVSYDADNAIDPPKDKTPPPGEDETPDPEEDPTPDPNQDDEGDDSATPPDSSNSDGETDADAEHTPIAASPLSTTHSADQMHTVAARTDERAWMWWLGGGLLAIAGTLAITTTLLTQRHSRKS